MKYFQYMLRDKNTGDIVHRYSGQAPPGDYTNCSTCPSSFTPPIIVHSSGKRINDQYDEIVCFDYDREHWVNLMRSATSMSKSDVIKNMDYNPKTRRFEKAIAKELTT